MLIHHHCPASDREMSVFVLFMWLTTLNNNSFSSERETCSTAKMFKCGADQVDGRWEASFIETVAKRVAVGQFVSYM